MATVRCRETGRVPEGEYGGERAEGGAEVMEINGNKWK
jgi:hypothetical protein